MERKVVQYRMQFMVRRNIAGEYPDAYFKNLGESIQFCAMSHILRSVGLPDESIVTMGPDEICANEDEKLAVPLRAGFSLPSPDQAIPFPDNVTPIFVSCNAGKEGLTAELAAYVKRYEPIGCRDEQTRDVLRGLGIEAYLMGCYTMCLPQRRKVPANGKVFLVDISENLEPFIPKCLKENAVRISHSAPVKGQFITVDEDDRLNRCAAQLLERYYDEAGLVVTSRLHSAAPCLAMGIPVVLASDNIDFRYGWLDKFLPIYTLDEYPDIDWNPDIADIGDVRERIQSYIMRRIQGDSAAREDLAALDRFYMDRPKADYYGFFRKRIAKAAAKFPSGQFAYIIWGAGTHGDYAYDLISEMFPNAVLKGVIDKFAQGRRFGHQICRKEAVGDIRFDLAFITTRPGTPEAIQKMEELFGDEAKDRYVVISSQQIC